MQHNTKHYLWLLLLIMAACTEVDNDQAQTDSAKADAYINRVIQVTTEYHLTELSTACLSYEVLDGEAGKMVIVNVYEKHNTACGGDPATSPRLFTMEFDLRNGEVWSDAKSMTGQMERLGPSRK